LTLRKLCIALFLQNRAPQNFRGAFCISKQTVNQPVNQGEKIEKDMGLMVLE